MKKNYACQLTVKNIHALGPKRSSYKEFDKEKSPCGSRIPHPP